MSTAVLIIGAGRSASTLIEYLAAKAPARGYHLTVVDTATEPMAWIQKQFPHVTTRAVDITQAPERRTLISSHDIVVSMLPAYMHEMIWRDCIEIGRHFFSASYVSPALREMAEQIRKKRLFFLQEMGLDPGIDHMSALQVIDEIHEQGGEVYSFKSYTGGLIAPESDDNPWHYKFTWNPYNVVTAGKDGAVFLQNGHIHAVPYHHLFQTIDDIYLPELGQFEGYYNRDSLQYQSAFRLPEAETLIRGTLRREGFCHAWHVLVELGMTADTVQIPLNPRMTACDFTRMFLPPTYEDLPADVQLARQLHLSTDDPIIEKLRWMGLFERKPLHLEGRHSPAKVLLHLLKPRWQMMPHDRDMIVMVHLFRYRMQGRSFWKKSYMHARGDNRMRTAMAKTVGLPLAIAIDLFIQGTINLYGLYIPNVPEIYRPVLEQLKANGIHFHEITKEI